MNYGIAHMSIIPMRAEASDKSEMVNQLLFGEHYKLIDKKAKWFKIRLAHDDYEGWISYNQYFEIDKRFHQIIRSINSFNFNLIDAITSDKGDIILLYWVVFFLFTMVKASL